MNLVFSINFSIFDSIFVSAIHKSPRSTIYNDDGNSIKNYLTTVQDKV